MFRKFIQSECLFRVCCSVTLVKGDPARIQYCEVYRVGMSRVDYADVDLYSVGSPRASIRTLASSNAHFDIL